MEPEPVSTGVGKWLAFQHIESSFIPYLKSVQPGEGHIINLFLREVFMEVQLNGRSVQVAGGSLRDLIQGQDMDLSSLVAEVNLKVIPESEWDLYRVQPGDTIELLSFVGGG